MHFLKSSAFSALWNGVFFVFCVLALSAALFLPALCAAQELTPEETRLWDAYQKGEMIRLHILADNDGPEAQGLKLKVRDALLEAYGREMKEAGTRDFSRAWALLQGLVPKLEDVARQCARDNGFEGAVAAEAGLLTLPPKSYGKVTLPAGIYHGLRITLGSGKGQNWWCVLFPQLCLALADSEPWQTQPQSAEETSLPLPESTAPAHSTQDPSQAPGEAPRILWCFPKVLRCWLLWP